MLLVTVDAVPFEGAVIARQLRAAFFDHFMALLAKATRRDQVWESGGAIRRTLQSLASLPAEAMPPSARDAIGAAMTTVDGQLRGKHLPHTLAHGDFTRFNVRQSGSRFTVFDWEYAHEDSNPIGDLLHYRLAQTGVPPTAATMQAVLAQVMQFSRAAFDGWSPSSKDLAALAVHSLVDTLAFYAAADDRLDLRSFLVQRYLRLVGSRQSWGLA